MTTVSSAWLVPEFRRVWAAGLYSGLGAEIGELALPSLALITLGATPAEASWVRAALLAPFLVMTLWLGVVVDRRRRRPLMVAADLGRGVILAILCLLALLGWLSIPVLVAATFALGTLTVLYQLADFSFLPHIVEEHQLVDANAKVTATQSAVSVVGSGVGGTLVQLLTAPIAVAANAVGYLSSALLIGQVRAVEKPSGRQPKASAVREARAGLRVLARHRVLRALVTEASLWNFGNEIFMLALSVHVLDQVAAGPLVLGIIVTYGALGAFVGSLLSARLTARFGYGRSLIWSMVIGNTAPLVGVVAVAGWPPGAVVALSAAFALSGIGIGVANSQSTAIRQIAITADLRGRVNAGYRLLSWGALSVGALLGGVLTAALGWWPAALVGTLLMALATVPLAGSPVRRVRALDEVERHRPDLFAGDRDLVRA